MKKVWVFVEGKSDVRALSVLWTDWKQKLGKKGWRVQLVPLENKSKYFGSIGARATDKLVQNEYDLVVGLPDLYPNREYANTKFKHSNLNELQKLQIQLVKKEVRLEAGKAATEVCMYRFYASALKHDLEMLLLAAHDQLRKRLKMSDSSVVCRQLPEEQNQNRPPKKLVEELFRTRLNRPYREITDSEAILSKSAIPDVLFDRQGNAQCPEFQSMLDWVGEKTGVPAYKKPTR